MAACLTGSEAGIHSPPWSSLENVEMLPQSLIGQAGRSAFSSSCDVYSSPLGQVCRSSNVVEINSAIGQQGSHDAAESCNDDDVCMQIGAAREEANVDLRHRLADLGINKQSSMGLAHPHADICRKQRSSLAELSFRIDFPGDMKGLLNDIDAFEMARLIESSNMLFGRGIGWNNFASEGDVESQCENEMLSKQDSRAENHTSVGHVDEGFEKRWNRGGPLSSQSDIRTPSRNSRLGRESRAPALSVNADCIDVKTMKVGGIELRKLPWKGSELLSSLRQSNEPKNFLLLERESQSQALSPRRKYDSTNASSRAEKYGADTESAIGHPRVAPSQNRALQAEAQVQDEDLHMKQGMLPRALQAEGRVQDDDLYMKQGMLPRALQAEARVQDENLCMKQGMLLRALQAEARVQDADLYMKEGMLLKALQAEAQVQDEDLYMKQGMLPRAFQAEARVQDEDLYMKQGLLPSTQHDYRTPFKLPPHQKAPQSKEEELCPVSTFMMDDHIASPQQHGYAGNSLAFQNDVEAYRAALSRAMQDSLSDPRSSSQLGSNSTQIHNIGAERNFLHQSDFSSQYFAGPHDHPHGIHSNKQFPVDPYCPRLPSSNRAYALPMDWNQLTWPPLASQKDICLDSAPTAYTCYKEHAYTQLPSHTPSCCLRPDLCAPTFVQQMARQRFPTQAHYLQHTNGKGLRKASQSSLHKLQLQREADSISQFHSACLARKENCPPLPGSSAPPYVLCQGCDKILQVPANLYNESAVQRIRCGACGRISKFCIVLHPYYRAIFKKGIATVSTQRAYGSNFSNKHWSHSAAAIPGSLSEQSSLYGAVQVKLDRSLGSSYVVGGQCDRVDKQMATQTKQKDVTCVVSNYVEKLDAPYCRRPTSTMLLEQGPCESEWRYGNSYRPLNSSGTTLQDYPSSTVCGYGPTTMAAGQWSHGLQQLESRPVDFVSQSAMLGESKEAFEAPVADDFIEETIDTRVRVSSGEIQGLTLQGSSSCDDMDSHNLQQGHGVSSDGVSPASCDVSQKKDHMDIRNLQQAHGQVGVPNNGVCPASCSPAPGSPLYEHLSYDAESEIIVELACKSVNGAKQAGGEPYVQDASKGSNFLSGLLKKNIRELGKGGQRSNNSWKLVVVNGRIIPHAAIKSAERLAGTIRPGVYWYDYEAGFWGVMGGPCLGIIPPFITELNAPLAKDCAGGTTEVYVNGRELHKKDLDALAGRGLPRTPGKAYMVDISGQVVDKASGQLLRSLGGLAPTIQRRGRGSGMFQPPTNS